MADLPPPYTFGLPEKFTEWRQHQPDALLRVVDSDNRFKLVIAPTGSGKSLIYLAAATIKGGRSVFLTSTKGLQSQLVRDFPNLVDIRGRNSYLCNYETDRTTCDHAPCVVGFQCRYRNGGGCRYYDALKRAQRSDMVVTNYAYWMYNNAHGDGFGEKEFNTLVCDEAHDAPDIVSSFLTIKLDRSDTFTRNILPLRTLNDMSISEWSRWAEQAEVVVADEADILKKKMEREKFLTKSERKIYAKLKRMSQDLQRMTKMDDTWITDVGKLEVSFCPTWPAPDCEDALFLGIQNIVLTSASVCMKTADMLGISEDDIEIMEYPHSFPVERRQIIHVPTVRMNYRTNQAGIKTWLTRIDQILKPRLDRKGIIHTVSYKRRDAILGHSKYRNQMMSHSRHNTELTVNKFRNSQEPKILVSPSVTTGWDFPYTDAEYQIVGKVPYPDTTNKIVKTRTKEDSDYAPYIAAQTLMQSCGRINRAADDQGETFVIDDNIKWFMYKYDKFMTGWFREAFVQARTIPRPPERLKI